MAAIDSIASFLRWQEELKSRLDPQAKVVTVCAGTGCTAFGAPAVIEAFREEIRERGLVEQISVKETGCHGFCEKGPLVVILPEKVFYASVAPEDVPEIVDSIIGETDVIERLLYVDSATKQRIVHDHEVPFYARQRREVFGLNGILDPIDLADYVARDGYAATAKALSDMTPEEVIGEISAAGLRGRGGAGFPTGRKWQFCRQASGDRKYLICNADEGDPGAFMDRSLLEGTPHAIIDGMIIAAYAIGANHGMIYVRAEYPLAVKNTMIALDQAREAGLLGRNILGTGFDFEVEVREGAGAFVCGEETALIASLEGARGMPRPRPPFPAHKGVFGKPTNINNVETFANVPLIIRKGAAWYSAIGTEGSKGTKVFALAGKVNNTGLVEVPMGITLRQIVFDIGDGIPDGGSFKAAQLGGPSGGCVPEQYLDLPIDYDSLSEVGAIMGSGGLIVMDDQTCMVDIARYFLDFTQSESCGKCVPCRVGTRHMLDTLKRICAGEGKEGDVEELESLAHDVKAGSLCGLGQTAPNPVLTTIRYFRDEYDAHIRDGYCPSHVCRGLFKYTIDAEACKGCGACVKACSEGAITGEKKQAHSLDQHRCVHCGACFSVCRFGAVSKVHPNWSPA